MGMISQRKVTKGVLFLSKWYLKGRGVVCWGGATIFKFLLSKYPLRAGGKVLYSFLSLARWLRDLFEACFTRFFSLTLLMRGRLAASLGWQLISLAEKDLTTSSNCSGKQTRGVILKLLLSKKDSLSDKKACLVFPQLHP